VFFGQLIELPFLQLRFRFNAVDFLQVRHIYIGKRGYYLLYLFRSDAWRRWLSGYLSRGSRGSVARHGEN
jgi:hypothetical protein